LQALTVGVGSGVLAIAMVHTIRRYYFPLGAQVLMSPLAVTAGVFLGASIAFVVLRCFRPAAVVSRATDVDVRREDLVAVGV
jgi:hypothetical protein